jgi:hypothetical protein
MDVLVLQSVIWSKQEDDFYIEAKRKLTGLGLKASRDNTITRRSRDALVLSI